MSACGMWTLADKRRPEGARLIPPPKATPGRFLLPACPFSCCPPSCSTQGINLPNVSSLLNAPTENRGAFMATNGMSLRAGQTIGPLFMASAAGTLGLTGAYLTAAGLALFAFLLVLALVR